ncbi:DUF6957 family protein [Pseudomonas putida]|uniref:DUF6957 family protein n=1 Tax=Pseudomonas putida TaxID=303 RepID=UPI0021195242|nr:hypothetical protein [Pseudomonas putida]
MFELALVENLLLQAGEPIVGGTASEAALIDSAMSRSERKHVCVVKEWVLLNVMVSDQDEELLRTQGLQPTVLFAREILFDSRCLGSRSGALRSSFQHSHDAESFDTLDVTYLLAGPGHRKHVSLPALLALDRWE